MLHVSIQDASCSFFFFFLINILFQFSLVVSLCSAWCLHSLWDVVTCAQHILLPFSSLSLYSPLSTYLLSRLLLDPRWQYTFMFLLWSWCVCRTHCNSFSFILCHLVVWQLFLMRTIKLIWLVLNFIKMSHISIEWSYCFSPYCANIENYVYGFSDVKLSLHNWDTCKVGDYNFHTGYIWFASTSFRMQCPRVERACNHPFS